MTIRFTSEVRTQASPDRVFAAMTDPEAMSRWMPNLVGIEALSEGPLQVGSRFRETRRMFGREATEHFEVTGYEPDRRLVLRVDGSQGTTGKGIFLFDHELVSEGEDTRVILRAEIDLGGGLFTRLMGWAMQGFFRKGIEGDLRALASWLEAGGDGALTGSAPAAR